MCIRDRHLGVFLLNFVRLKTTYFVIKINYTYTESFCFFLPSWGLVNRYILFCFCEDKICWLCKYDLPLFQWSQRLMLEPKRMSLHGICNLKIDLLTVTWQFRNVNKEAHKKARSCYVMASVYRKKILSQVLTSFNWFRMKLLWRQEIKWTLDETLLFWQTYYGSCTKKVQWSREI